MKLNFYVAVPFLICALVLLIIAWNICGHEDENLEDFCNRMNG